VSREQLLLISSLGKLKQRYGQAGLDKIRASLDRYKGSLSSRKIVLTVVFLDDEASLSSFDLKPVRPVTPATAKAAIDHIISRLNRADDSGKVRKSGESGTSILILGGGEVIPYFKLRNPALDSDDFVASDNPYGCPPGSATPDKCLLPRIPVGRMPDGRGADDGILLRQLDTACEAANGSVSTRISFKKSGFGYTAGVWKEASQRVWRDIGFAGSLRICPPASDNDVNASWFRAKEFLYFNVHGSDSEPYWFGQKGSSFPKALSPESVNRFFRGRSMVVTEACYGAIEMDRQSDSSISLAFLVAGSSCVVGSTCTAYGALTPPVSEADLIALHFFRNVHEGLSFGSALVKARAQLAATAMSRQGFLDEDDKKTLLQFLLFGDPTVSVPPFSPGSDEDAKNAKPRKRIKKG